jgi:hemolysin D
MDNLPVTSPTLRLTAWLLLLLFIAVVGGSYFGKTEIVSRGIGRVLARGRTQTIQPQFDGKISEIKVIDGATVKAGDILVVLDSTQLNSDFERLTVNLEQVKNQLALHEAVLKALHHRDPAAKDFVLFGKAEFSLQLAPLSVTPEYTSLLEDTLKSYAASASELNGQVRQLESKLNTAATKLANAEQDRTLLQERLAKAGGVSSLISLDQKKAVATADQNIRLAVNQQQELEAQISVSRQSRDRYISTLRADQQQKLADLRELKVLTSAQLEIEKNKLYNTTITSPASGRVENLQVFTQGGFVQAGQYLMSVVPGGEGLDVEALFENRDAGFLAQGQIVFIKLDAYPAERFGILRGKVTSVSADARKDELTKSWVYSAKIMPESNYVERDGKKYPIIPGMTGTTDVVTGERRLISYFFEPLVKTIQDGFGER